MFALSMLAYVTCMFTAIYYKKKKNHSEMVFWLFMALSMMLATK